MDGAEKCDVGHMLGWVGASLAILEAHHHRHTEKTQNNTKQLKQHTKTHRPKKTHNPNQRQTRG
jgi:hypothetical protein